MATDWRRMRALEKEQAAARHAVMGRNESETHIARMARILQAKIPDDTRDLTGRILGDPIPGDPRRPWLPGATQ